MQIAALPISLPISINAALPMVREKIINSYGYLYEGYKDEWEAEFYRKRGIGINSIRNSTK